MSVMVVPIDTGTFFKYSVVGSTNNRASMLNVWDPMGRDRLASAYPKYSILSPPVPSMFTNLARGFISIPLATQ